MPELTCPRCGDWAPRGGYPWWAVVLAILFFPFGFLAFLAGRDPTTCPKCGYTWQA